MMGTMALAACLLLRSFHQRSTTGVHRDLITQGRTHFGPKFGRQAQTLILSIARDACVASLAMLSSTDRRNWSTT